MEGDEGDIWKYMRMCVGVYYMFVFPLSPLQPDRAAYVLI